MSLPDQVDMTAWYGARLRIFNRCQSTSMNFMDRFCSTNQHALRNIHRELTRVETRNVDDFVLRHSVLVTKFVDSTQFQGIDSKYPIVKRYDNNYLDLPTI